ncbi:MAG TPA: hypothetical protein VHC44_15155 [Verrucomicrobiae bacterium]|nr:hypothetical protein [Verrucomicrobiae bacterium]
MNPQEPSRNRRTIKIKLPPKPSAPRHQQALARAVPMPNVVEQGQKKHSLFLFPMAQVTLASILAMMVLDMGECSHIVAFAALAYVGGLLMMIPRRDALTPVDEFLIRWGFVMLCVISLFLSPLIWLLRGC